ncbi:MAG TPA: DUF6541 family protein, partial [Marmoricola sp.]|nr:DUF6541 family protein [Marmoricola sp.]
MDDWLKVFPQFLFMLAIFALPGLLVALSLRFRLWDAIGLSVPLTLGVLGVANVVSTRGALSWGMPLVSSTTAVMIALGGMWSIGRAFWLGRRPGRIAPSVRDVDGERWSRRQQIIAAAVTLGAALIGAFVVARGIG